MAEISPLLLICLIFVALFRWAFTADTDETFSTIKCAKEFFDAIGCPNGTVILVTDVVQGASLCVEDVVTEAEGDCSAVLSRDSGNFLNHYGSCNWRQTCGELKAKPLKIPECGMAKAQYVRMEYQCVIPPTEPPTTTQEGATTIPPVTPAPTPAPTTTVATTTTTTEPPTTTTPIPTTTTQPPTTTPEPTTTTTEEPPTTTTTPKPTTQPPPTTPPPTTPPPSQPPPTPSPLPPATTPQPASTSPTPAPEHQGTSAQHVATGAPTVSTPRATDNSTLTIGDLDMGVVLGIPVASLIALVGIIVAVFICLRTRRDKQKSNDEHSWLTPDDEGYPAYNKESPPFSAGEPGINRAYLHRGSVADDKMNAHNVITLHPM